MIKAAVLLLVFACVPLLPGQEAARQTVGSEVRRWQGKLVDVGRSSCGVEAAGAAPSGMCPVSVATASFGFVAADGKMLKLDEGGNAKAMDALKKSKKASKVLTEYWRTGKVSRQVSAMVTGTLTGDTLNVDTIRVE